MVNRFNLKDLEFNKKLYTHYHIYDLEVKNEIFKLKLFDEKSTTIANLITAFTDQPPPNIDLFVNKLEEKIKLKVGLLLE